METYGVFSFSSSHHAMAAENILSSEDYSAYSENAILKEARLIPLPPEISAGCGLVLRVNEKGIKAVANILSQADIPYSNIHLLKIKNNKRQVEKYDLS